MTTRHRQAAAQQGSLYAILVLATFLMGSSFIAGKILLADGYPALLLVGWRFLLAALATLPLLWLQSKPVPGLVRLRDLDARGAAIVVLIGLLQTAAVMGLLFLSMRTISAANCASGTNTPPAAWISRRRPSARLSIPAEASTASRAASSAVVTFTLTAETGIAASAWRSASAFRT